MKNKIILFIIMIMLTANLLFGCSQSANKIIQIDSTSTTQGNYQSNKQISTTTTTSMQNTVVKIEETSEQKELNTPVIKEKQHTITHVNITKEDIVYTKLPNVRGVSQDMYISDFWTKDISASNKELNDLESIQQINTTNTASLEFLNDIFSYDSIMDSKWIKEQILQLSRKPTYSRYKNDGSIIKDSFYNMQYINLDLDNISGEINYGMTIRRTYMKMWPSDEKAYTKTSIGKYDRFLETAVSLAEPLAILHKSKDGKWYFVSMYNYSGWVPAKDIAIGEKEEIVNYANSEDFIIITGSKLFLESEERIQVDMGVKLALWTEDDLLQSEEMKDNYIIRLPIANDNGNLEFSIISIDKNNDITPNYLAYTTDNIINQAFKVLTESYGWGGDNGNRDCSSFIMDIYRTFGINLPRNTGQQELAEGIKINLQGMSTHTRLQTIKNLAPGTVLYMNGHTVLYLGMYNGEPYIIHDVATVYETSSLKPVELSQVAVTPLTIYIGSGIQYMDLLTVGVNYSIDKEIQKKGVANKNTEDLTKEKLLNKLDCEQVILIEGLSENSYKANISLYEKNSDTWQLVKGDIHGVIGKNGLGKTKEGDKKSPTGIFSIGSAFGFNNTINNDYPYFKITENSYWVDDSNSKYYNQLVEYKNTYFKDWNSAENMSKISLYDYGFIINYNMDAEMNKGSAIFMHTFRDVNSPTVGCTAVSATEMKNILEWLDIEANPLIIQGTQEDVKTWIQNDMVLPYRLPDGFVYVKDIIPNIKEDIKYVSTDNFTGQIVQGYYDNTAILTYDATLALQKVQNELNDMGYSLVIFDGYRPKQAVESFVEWTKNENDVLNKEKFYPDITKNQLIPQGYIGAKSSHSRGSTVDVGIINLTTGEELDMGGYFDYFGKLSNYNYPNLDQIQKDNRKLLKDIMEKHGFIIYEGEWWHFKYINESFPNTFFDFPVKR